jgi:hypothetical protein
MEYPESEHTPFLYAEYAKQYALYAKQYAKKYSEYAKKM